MSKVAKYTQIENYFIDKINSGELKIGDQIETEEELVEKFGFSRMTINKALSKLMGRDYITRIPGRGSFVKATHVTKSLDKHSSFTEDMKEIGLVPESRLLNYKFVPAKDYPKIPEKLKMDGNNSIHYFERLRLGSGTPIAISHNYISSDVVPDLSIDALNASLYEHLRSNGYILLGNDVEIEAVLPDETQKKLLKFDSGAILKTKVTTTVLYEGREQILGYFETFYNGNVYTYKFNR